LQSQSPALYGAYLDFQDYTLICNSPELFLYVDPSRRVTTRPIKGTRASGAGMANQLRDSEKDQAELNMIIDLERNDLGRVCEIGSVHVRNRAPSKRIRPCFIPPQRLKAYSATT
jgi:anthranilate/para-aminobenzoate synthase component I